MVEGWKRRAHLRDRLWRRPNDHRHSGARSFATTAVATATEPVAALALATAAVTLAAVAVAATTEPLAALTLAAAALTLAALTLTTVTASLLHRGPV